MSNLLVDMKKYQPVFVPQILCGVQRERTQRENIEQLPSPKVTYVVEREMTRCERDQFVRYFRATDRV